MEWEIYNADHTIPIMQLNGVLLFNPGGWLWLRRQSRSSTNQKVASLIPVSLILSAKVSLGKILNPKLPKTITNCFSDVW